MEMETKGTLITSCEDSPKLSHSKFTRRHFDDLAAASTSYSSPLAVIAHIDLDAFYAQCEQVRLGLSVDKPVVCRQWNALLAISYAARKFGISRMETVEGALKLCPDLIYPHVATFKKGETVWKHHENPDVDNYKVSLDPFRRESRKIFGIFKSYCDVIEKAGIDETFLDLGSLVRKKAISMFPRELASKNDNDPDEYLHLPPSELPNDIKWYGKVFRGESPVSASDGDNSLETKTSSSDGEVKISQGTTTTASSIIKDLKTAYSSSIPDDAPSDWEDILLMIGSSIVDEIRRDIFARLKYTCSAGISRNKILAKLASPRNKPNGQTVVPNTSIIDFMCSCEVTDMWGLGGKLGDEVVSKLGVPENGSIQYLLNIPLETMQKKLDEATGRRIHHLIRGQESSEVTTRVNIKSMQAVKQFSKPLKDAEDCKAWIKVFASELAGRIIELDEEDINGIPLRPKTVAIQQGQYKPHPISRRKQAQFPRLLKTTTFEEISDQLVEAGESLLSLLEAENSGTSLYPCSSLSLSVSGIVAVTDHGSRTIDNYFKKGEKIDYNNSNPHNIKKSPQEPEIEYVETGLLETNTDSEEEDSLFVSQKTTCHKCGKLIKSERLDEHSDWHFAKELQEEDEHEARHSPQPRSEPTKHQHHRSSPSSPKKARPIKKSKVENNRSVLDLFRRGGK